MIALNIQGMKVDAKSKGMYKLDYLREYLKDYKGFIPIIAITETWLKSYVTKAQIQIPNYTHYRSDREHRKRGGVLTYVHDSISVDNYLKFDNKYYEATIICK